MRRILLTILILLICSSGNAAISNVQNVGSNGDASGDTSHSVTITAATSGNLLVSCMAGDGNTGTITVPSGFTLLNENVGTVSGSCAYKVSTGGETSVQWSWVNSVSSNAWVGEWSGTTATPLDVKTENGTWASVSSISTGTTSATAQNDEIGIAVAFCGDFWRCNSNSWTNSYTTLRFVSGTTNDPAIAISTKTLSSTGAQETTFDYTADASAPTEAYAQIMTFKASAAAATMITDNGTSVF